MSDNAHQRLTFITIAGAVAAGWLLIGTWHETSPAEEFWTGLMLGTAYGHAALAAVWLALGPPRLAHRWLVTLAALGGVLAALLVAASHGRSRVSIEDLILLGGSTLGQWLLIALLLWGLRARGGLRIESEAAPAIYPSPFRPQFTIRHVMQLTAVVAVVLGVGRLLLTGIDWQVFASGAAAREGPIFAYVVLVNILLTLPLAAAVLLPERAALASIVAIVFVVAATWVELQACVLVMPGPANHRVTVVFCTMNAAQAVWMLAILGLLRGAGYRLSRHSHR